MDKREMAALLSRQTSQCERNRFSMLGQEDERMWEEPLIAFAAGSDPLFQFLKEDIGDFYMTPPEVFQTKYPDAAADGADLTVACLAFAQTAVTKEEQAKQKTVPCLRWVLSRNTWKAVSDEFYDRIGAALTEQGIRFVVPDRMPEMRVRRAKKYGLAAVWSHRHAAMIAGLGTFGLSDGFITRNGIAIRLVSLVMEQRIEPDAREYGTEPYGWCLFHQNGSCGACIKRCPAGAVTKAGHDKEKCSDYLNRMEERHCHNPMIDQQLEVGCGLCQCVVPCAEKRRVAKL